MAYELDALGHEAFDDDVNLTEGTVLPGAAHRPSEPELADLVLQINGQLPHSLAVKAGAAIAKRYGIEVVLRAADTYEEVQTFTGHSTPETRDWTVKPVINSAQNKHVQGLIDRIYEAKDLPAARALAELQAIGQNFRGKNTYYRLARSALEHWIAVRKAELFDAENALLYG